MCTCALFHNLRRLIVRDMTDIKNDVFEAMRDYDGFLSSYCFYLSLFIRLDIFFVVCEKKNKYDGGVCGRESGAG